MLGARAIRLAALALAVCRMGLLITGLVLLAVEEVGDEGGEDITGEVAAVTPVVVVDVDVEEEEEEEAVVVAEVVVEVVESGALLV